LCREASSYQAWRSLEPVKKAVEYEADDSVFRCLAETGEFESSKEADDKRYVILYYTAAETTTTIITTTYY